MSKALLTLTSVALLALSLPGCANTPETKMDSKPAATASAISTEAQAALSAAQAAVKDVKSKNVEWTTSDSALKAAEEAAAKGDSATVLKQAKWASDQAKLALGQMNYPVLKVGD
jgi:PBP1b-binding outer membrane lipoprotein LpoB